MVNQTTIYGLNANEFFYPLENEDLPLPLFGFDCHRLPRLPHHCHHTDFSFFNSITLLPYLFNNKIDKVDETEMIMWQCGSRGSQIAC